MKIYDFAHEDHAGCLKDPRQQSTKVEKLENTKQVASPEWEDWFFSFLTQHFLYDAFPPDKRPRQTQSQDTIVPQMQTPIKNCSSDLNNSYYKKY